MMKKLILLFTLFTTLYVPMSADDGSAAAINLEHRGHDDHLEFYIPADEPEAYYDNDAHEIIIVADGFASYYGVEIITQTTLTTLISTQISGYGDTIDVSSLASGDYIITISSPTGHEFEGEFTIY